MRKALLLIVFASVSAVCFADITIVESVKTSSIMGQPPQDSITTISIKGSKARIDQKSTGNFQILDLKANKILIVDNAKKQATSMSLDIMKQAGGMMGAMGQNMKLDVKKTGAVKTINGFKCEEYTLAATGPVGLNMTQCVSQDIDTTEFEGFKAFADSFMKMFSSQAEVLPKGIPIRSEGKMSMMGQNVTTSTEVQSISKDPIADSVFQLPADYKVQDLKGMVPPNQ